MIKKIKVNGYMLFQDVYLAFFSVSIIIVSSLFNVAEKF